MRRSNAYISAATRERTQRSYASAVRHFEVEWGGLLPASGQQVADYLAEHASVFALNTLRQRLAALSDWHQAHGFPDPAKLPVVRKTLKGIARLHPERPKQARPVQLVELEQIVAALDRQRAKLESDSPEHLRIARDKALLLLGFWRGFRSDELIRLRVEHIEWVAGQGMVCTLDQTKNDAIGGRTFRVPALSRLCPVGACLAWIALAQITDGPLFRGIDRWHRVCAHGLHANSVIPLLRRVFAQAGLTTAAQYSSHSLRRGFATWANANGWELKALMEYVGWRDVKSALRYIDAPDPFGQARIERALSGRADQPS
ncbi:site-specific integrase [Niveibacterium sp. SC-1]|uniref:site-specific integrase n=1 Tax=Niveibacterium sp. SC-1 TaxID=3135646 RepID=UPI00311F80BD